MKEAKTKGKNGLLPGTVEMLIRKTLSIEPMHGYGMAQQFRWIQADGTNTIELNEEVRRKRQIETTQTADFRRLPREPMGFETRAFASVADCPAPGGAHETVN